MYAKSGDVSRRKEWSSVLYDAVNSSKMNTEKFTLGLTSWRLLGTLIKALSVEYDSLNGLGRTDSGGFNSTWEGCEEVKTLCGVVYLRIRVGQRYWTKGNQRKFVQRCEIPTCTYADRSPSALFTDLLYALNTKTGTQIVFTKYLWDEYL